MPQSLSQVETNIRIPGISQIYNIRYEETKKMEWVIGRRMVLAKGAGWQVTKHCQSTFQN